MALPVLGELFLILPNPPPDSRDLLHDLLFDTQILMCFFNQAMIKEISLLRYEVFPFRENADRLKGELIRNVNKNTPLAVAI